MRAKYKQRTNDPIESSTGLASICRSTGLASSGVNVSSCCAGFRTTGAFCFSSLLLSVLRCDLPFLSRRKDSLSDFLNDFRREIGESPAPVRSETLINQTNVIATRSFDRTVRI